MRKQIGQQLLLVLFIISAGCASKKTLTTLDPMVKSQLAQYRTQLEDKENLNADLLSPQSYQKAKKVYDRAKNSAYDGSSLEQVKQILAAGEKHFEEINEHLSMAYVHLDKVLAARNRAQFEEVDEIEEFKEAEQGLRELAQEIEDNDLNSVLEDRDQVKKLYRQAEIKAIKNRVLEKVQRNLKLINKYQSLDHFDKELGELKGELKTATLHIEDFPNNPQRYGPTVEKAHQKSRRLLALVQTADMIEHSSPRELTLKIDTDLNQTLMPLEYPEAQYLSYQDKVLLLKNEVSLIPNILAELNYSQFDSYMQKSRIGKLKKEKKKLKKSLDKQKQLRKKITSIESMFSNDQAKVQLDGENVVIRLIGLNFAFDDYKLPEGANDLLNKVAQSTAKFDQAKIEVIGHADSRGNSLYNDRLSTKRAQAVRNYLKQQANLEEEKIEVVGKGFKRPIAENKTHAGRQLNRRVDIIITPAHN